MTEDVVLAAAGLCVRRGEREVLHEVHLSIARGEVLAVLGPNGAGKSTLLSTLGGTLRPQAGQVERVR